MKKVLKWMGIVVGSLLGLVMVDVVAVLVIGRARFNETVEVEVPSLEIPTDEAALARGEHLVTAVAHCGYCHGEDLAGEFVLNRPSAQGVIVAPNLTAGEGGFGAGQGVGRALVEQAESWVRAVGCLEMASDTTPTYPISLETVLRTYPKNVIISKMCAQANWMKANQLAAFLHQRMRRLRRLASQARVRSTTQRRGG